MRNYKLLLSFYILFLLAIHSRGYSQSSDEFVPCQEMPHLIETYNADLRALTRFYTSSFYGARNTGNPVSTEGGSPEKRARLEELYHEYLKKLDNLDFKSLPQECKVDYILFKRDLTEKLRSSAGESVQYNKISTWFPFADSIYAIEKLRRRGHPLDAQQLAKNWSDYAGQIRTLGEKLKADKGLDMESIYAAGLVISDLQRAVTNIYEFYNGYDPLFTWWMPGTYKELDSALSGYAARFREKNSSFAAADKSGIVGHPVGREELVRQLKF